CAFAAVAVLQTVAPPPFGSAFPIWKESAAVLQLAIGGATAAVSYRPLTALSSPLLGVVATMCGIAITASTRNVRAFLSAIAVFGVAYSVFGLVWYSLVPGYVLWWPKEAHVYDLTATFTNRNTAAVFLGIGLIILSARAAANYDRYRLAIRRRHAEAARNAS